jgi:hypothetical protein
LGGEFGWVADYGADGVATGEEFSEDAAAGFASGSVEGDVHGVFSEIVDAAATRWMSAGIGRRNSPK